MKTSLKGDLQSGSVGRQRTETELKAIDHNQNKLSITDEDSNRITA